MPFGSQKAAVPLRCNTRNSLRAKPGFSLRDISETQERHRPRSSLSRCFYRNTIRIEAVSPSAIAAWWHRCCPREK